MSRPGRARLAVAGAAVVAVALLGTWGVSGALRVREMRREIEAAEREVAALRQQARRLSDTIERLRHDPAYIEKLAREEHGLVREGEVILKFPARPR